MLLIKAKSEAQLAYDSIVNEMLSLIWKRREKESCFPMKDQYIEHIWAGIFSSHLRLQINKLIDELLLVANQLLLLFFW